MSFIEEGLLRLLSLGSSPPRVVTALVRILVWSVLFVALLGVIFLHAYLGSLPPPHRSHLLRLFWTPLDFLRYGMLVATGFDHGQRLLTVVTVAACALVWFWAFRLLALTSTSFAKEAMQRLDENKQGEVASAGGAEPRERRKDLTSTLMELPGSWGCSILVLLFTLGVLLRLGDLLLCALLLAILGALALLLTHGGLLAGGDSVQGLGEYLSHVDLATLNFGDLYFGILPGHAAIADDRLHLLAITALVLAWISFRQSATFLALRTALLTLGVLVLFLLAYSSGLSHGRETVTFWRVQVECDRPGWPATRQFLLLDRSAKGVLLYDPERQLTHEIAAGLQRITFVAKSPLDEAIFGRAEPSRAAQPGAPRVGRP